MLLGIDLGTTNSLVSIYDPAKQESILLCELVPSVVNFETKTAGKAEKEQLLSNNNAPILASFKVNMSLDVSGKISREASALVLKELSKYTQNKPCVISVPAYFTDSQRKATLESAGEAGLNVPCLINEPTAAALYYNRDKKAVTAIYDLGGGTFDISIVDSRHGIYDVLATDGMMLGGDNLNMAIRDRIFSECRVKRHKLNDSIERQFLEIAEKLKLTVQRENYAKLDFPEYKEVFQKTTFILNEETYMSLVDAVFKITIVLTHAAINKAGYKKEEIKLILVGGSTRDPYLVKLISQTMKPEPLTYDPDRIVAQGAAYYAYLVHQGQSKSSVSDVTKAIGIELEDDEMEFIISPNSKLPITESCIVRNAEDTEILKINVRQGNSVVASRNDLIGTMNYRYSEKKKKGDGLVTVKIAVGVDGTIEVKVKEPMKKEECIALCQN